MDEEESRAARVGQKKMTTPTLVGPTSKKNLPCMTLKKKTSVARRVPPGLAHAAVDTGLEGGRRGGWGGSSLPLPLPQTSNKFGVWEEGGGSNQPPNPPPWLHTTAREPKRAHLKFHEKTCKCACDLVFLSQTFTRVRNEVLLSRLPAILSIVSFTVSQLLARHCHGDGALPYMANASS